MKLAHGEITGTVKANALVVPALGFALVIVALAVPPQVIDGLVNLIAMANVNRTEADPEMEEGGDTAHGMPGPVIPAQVALPLKDAAVIENTPFVNVQVVLALHGKGPMTVTVIGPEKVTLPLDTQALPFHICQLAADAEKVAKELTANKAARSIALRDFIHTLLM